MQRFLDSNFTIPNQDSSDPTQLQHRHTIGVEFASKSVRIGKHKVKLQMWDTAGSERFRSVTKSYYRGAAGALLVFDLTDRRSFETVSQWLDDARRLASADIVVVLVGNKADLDQRRQVSGQEAVRMASQFDIPYVETSAFSGAGVEDVFMRCASSILANIETGRIDPEKMGAGVQFNSSFASQPGSGLNNITRFEMPEEGRRRKCCNS